MRERAPGLHRRRWPRAAAAAALGAVAAADHRGLLLVRGPDDLVAYHGATALVTRIIEGDLIEVALPDDQYRLPRTQVRLLGIQCPRPDQALATDARRLTRLLAEGGTVILLLEPHRTRADLGRVLAHVQLPDGTSLNQALLASGLARADDRIPHALLGRHDQVEQSARRQELGIWAPREGAGTGAERRARRDRRRAPRRGRAQGKRLQEPFNTRNSPGGTTALSTCRARCR